MRDHPRSARRKTLRAVLATPCGAHRFSRAAAAASAMGILCCGQKLRRGCAALVGRVRQSALARHRCAIGRGQECPRRLPPALRTFMGQVAVRHWPHPCERPAAGTKVVVDRHGLPSGFPRSIALLPAKSAGGSKAPPPAGRRTEALLIRRHRHGDAALDMLDGSGGARHHIEIEDVGRKPQGGAGVGNIDDA
jgi:hypothetical protein